MIVALYFRDRIFTDPVRYIVRVERVEVLSIRWGARFFMAPFSLPEARRFPFRMFVLDKRGFGRRRGGFPLSGRRRSSGGRSGAAGGRAGHL